MLQVTQLIAKRWFVLMLAYTFARLVFFLNNVQTFSLYPADDILAAWIHGLRFDAYAILWTNIPFWILAFLPLEKASSTWPRIEAIGFAVWNFFFIGLNFIDAEMYPLTGKRISFEILSLQSDVKNQAWTLISYYWHLAVILVITCTLLFYVYPRRNSALRPSFKAPLTLQAPVGLVLVVLMVLGMRGGWQLKPIRPIHAYTEASPELGALTLNSAFTFIRSRGVDGLGRLEYFQNPKEVGRWVQHEVTVRKPLSTHKNFNVVVIILESFSLEYMGWPDGSKEQMPFLNELARKHRFFPYHFANGRRSIDAVPSIVCGLPSMMLEPFPTSDYQGNQLRCLGHVLSEHGYETLFFHGAQNGSMYIDSFARRAGFEKFYGNNEYPYEGGRDGHWGVFDGPFLKFALEEMSRMQKPFASVIFTLSSHNPYRIPEEWKGKLPKGSMDIHESIAYTDAVLREFFEQAQKQSWYSNTIFVVTADHTSKSEDARFQNVPGLFRVPLILFSGGRDLPAVDTQDWAQQADITPSLLDVLGVYEPRFLPFGRSLFNLETPGRVVNYDSAGYWLLKEHIYLHMDFNGEPNGRGRWDQSQFMTAEKPTDEELKPYLFELRALAQYFNNGLLENSWEELEKWGFQTRPGELSESKK